MPAAELVAAVPDLAKSEDWISIKKQGVVILEHHDAQVDVAIAAQATKVGNLRFFVCPRCGRRCRDLFSGEQLGCRRCLRVRHPDQALSGSRWNRRVVRPARQVARIDERLLRRDLDRNQRRRLRRRRQRLLRLVEGELGQRQLDLRAALALVLP